MSESESESEAAAAASAAAAAAAAQIETLSADDLAAWYAANHVDNPSVKEWDRGRRRWKDGGGARGRARME